MSQDQLNEVAGLRMPSYRELSATHQPQDMERSLENSDDLIAIVQITDVQLPYPPENPRTRFSLSVNKFLRGSSPDRELRGWSEWLPPATHDHIRTFSGRRGTALDTSEPRLGGIYLIGWTPAYSNGDIYLTGAIDLENDPTNQLEAVKKVLAVSASAKQAGIGPWVTILSDPQALVRDVAAAELVRSQPCNAEPSCRRQYLNEAALLLKSNNAGERAEALRWLHPLVQPMGSPMGGPNGLPPMSTNRVRELLAAEVADANLVLGDTAFLDLAFFDVYHSASPGQCLEIVPPLRKTAVWTTEEVKNKSTWTFSSLGGTLACTTQATKK